MTTVQPTHRIVQLSDLHLTAEHRPLHGVLDSDALLQAAFDRVAARGLRVDAFVCSGDLADAGAPDAYRRLRAILDEQSARFGCPVLVGMGNHDERGSFHEHLLGSARTQDEIDSVTDVRGLRIVHLDSSVPASGYGELTGSQLARLRDVLSSPAPHGTALVVHHPPVPVPTPLLQPYDFRSTEALAEVVGGTDVRVILSGHWHVAATSALAGVPVVISRAVAYDNDPASAQDGYQATRGDQGFTIVEFFEGQVLATSVPIAAPDALETA
ncbi:3',5'-cyclic adenosine monophosphate phosphodiesterase CpdA [Brooklawnia cerclae]|uniref:3',5'-cyclic AMP phosphodiesterase CpdA n=1 Tax=Brooklawnia cerclae TaxID=349934 RepID=A0ABX0SEL7_9ACTN|nr:3',5'-cyclic AMP phosphodiesterase CpdA [Brooklawnia cerclae]